MANKDVEKVMQNATDIINKDLIKYPNLKRFLDMIVMNKNVDIKHVGKTCQYPQDIIKNKYFSQYGTFIYCFIRKHLSNQMKIKITDDIAELIIKQPDSYLKKQWQNAIKNHYEIFKDHNKRAMDTLKSIKIVSLSYQLYFQDPLPKTELQSDDNSLREVMKYFEKLPYRQVDMKPDVSCKYFTGNADLIFDQSVLYEIKTSKYKSLSSKDTNISLTRFYKMILYDFGYYKKTGKMLKNYKIYNPLLGYEYSLRLNDIDLVLFEQFIKHDVEKLIQSKSSMKK